MSQSIFNEDAPASTTIQAPRSRSLWIPFGILLGFAALFASVLRDKLLPAPEVEVVQVAVARIAATESRNVANTSDRQQVLFQAAGWIEPDPLPTRATALVNGIIDQVFVLEGEAVTNGQPLATLVDDDYRFELSQAKHALTILQAERATHFVRKDELQARLFALDAETTVARAKLAELEDEANRLAALDSDIVPASEISQAKLKVLTQEAEIKSVQMEAPAIQADMSRHDALLKQLDRRIELASVAIEQAALNLRRTRITSPITGRILRLFATPGRKQMLNSDQPDSTTVAVLYAPEKLQVRVDVALADAGALEVGMPARIRLDLLPDQVLTGRVTRIVGEADLQRNTLQAKVAIANPDPRLRPEMLARVEFLPPGRTARESDDAENSTMDLGSSNGDRLTVFAPPECLHNREGSEATTWVVHQGEKTAAPRKVKLGSTQRHGWISIRDGLRPGDWLIVSPVDSLKPGQRIRIHRPDDPYSASPWVLPFAEAPLQVLAGILDAPGVLTTKGLFI